MTPQGKPTEIPPELQVSKIYLARDIKEILDRTLKEQEAIMLFSILSSARVNKLRF